MASYDYSITSLQSHLSMLRKLYGWTMEQFGDRIGVTKQTVSNLERGKPKMTKLQYIAIRSVFESEAKERDGEEKEILLKILDLVCDPDPDVSEVQRSEALNTAAVAAGAAASGVAAAPAIKVLTSSLISSGLFVAAPAAIPFVTSSVTTASWLSKMLREKNAEDEKKKKGK